MVTAAPHSPGGFTIHDEEEKNAPIRAQCFTPRHKPYLVEVVSLDELRTTIYAELIPTTSSPGVTVFATAFCRDLHVNHIATLGAIPYRHIDPPVVKVGAAGSVSGGNFPDTLGVHRQCLIIQRILYEVSWR